MPMQAHNYHHSTLTKAIMMSDIGECMTNVYTEEWTKRNKEKKLAKPYSLDEFFNNPLGPISGFLS